VNSGSVEKDILAAYPSINGKISAKALVASASRHVAMLEDLDFGNIVLSLKSSDVETTVEAYRLMSAQSVYPLHLGVTEAGTLYHGIIKSSAGIGCLLLEGIGDTIRVSLTAPPVEEIRAGIALLRAVGIRNDGVEIISCPTCGRTGIVVAKIADELEAALASRTGHLKIAVMGCVVNGPGEAKECDIGVAAAGTGNEGMAVLFKKGRILRRIKEDEIVREILKEIDHGVQNI
jgi:(E)-4-hydroxy-3-methylbut-2-enyl-diphosphate synthase